jgi:hypothetical protein
MQDRNEIERDENTALREGSAGISVDFLDCLTKIAGDGIGSVSHVSRCQKIVATPTPERFARIFFDRNAQKASEDPGHPCHIFRF